ncbi:hypothetical protein GCM10009789_82350 [Kribbella sancticallisti]|uniref:Integral membrane protein n=1 Tax=Kribbella sancticallisti TaxID=460087 RepID=A0ABN2ERX3_9ACTN
MSASTTIDGTGGPPRFVATVLRVDALASGGLGVLLAALGPALNDALGLPGALTLVAGCFLIVWAAALWAIARRPVPIRALIVVVAVNVAWVAASVALVFGVAATGLGSAFVIAQAGAVAGFAGLQLLSIRKSA